MLNGYYIKKKGETSKGPRVWLQGSQPESAGFTPGRKYDISIIEGKTVVLTVNANGSRIVSSKKKTNSNELAPVIDINSHALLAIFDGMAAVQVIFKDGEIVILPLVSEIKKQERYQRLKSKLACGDPLLMGSLFHGGGIMSNALHHGLNKAGIPAKLAFANDTREELLVHAQAHNDAWDEDTMMLAAPMQELAFDYENGLAMLPPVEIFEAGIACSGASKSGRSKLGLAHPEAHEHVGHLIVSTLVILNKVNPAICVFECVGEYAGSASADILRSQLAGMGYETHERILNGVKWGALENRNRWFMIGVTQGISFDFDSLMPPVCVPRCIGDILDDIGPDDSRWSKMEGLRKKAISDKAAGKGFAMQIYTEDSPFVNVINKLYSKVQSTTPKLQHPTNPELLRQFTAAEHARIKGIFEYLVAGLPETTAHEILGQSVIFDVVEDIGTHVGKAINRFGGRPEVFVANPAATTAPAAVKGAVIDHPTISADEFTLEFFSLASLVVDKIKHAQTSDEQYAGSIVAVDHNLMIQDVGHAEGVIHRITNLDRPPKLGEIVSVFYRDGNGVVIHEDCDENEEMAALPSH